MQEKNNEIALSFPDKKKIHRKKFFTSIGTGFLGFVVFNSIPFGNILSGKKVDKIDIKINPLAVKRNKLGGNNA